MFISCSRDKNKVEHNNLYFSNDMESVRGFMDAGTIQEGKAHSGKYYSKTDSAWQYSISFNMPVGKISEKPLKKVDILIRVYWKRQHQVGITNL